MSKMMYEDGRYFWNPVTGQMQTEPPVSRERWVDEVYERASGNGDWWRILQHYFPRLAGAVEADPDGAMCLIDGRLEEVSFSTDGWGLMLGIEVSGRHYGPLGFLRKYLKKGSRPLAAEIRDMLDEWDGREPRERDCATEVGVGR